MIDLKLLSLRKMCCSSTEEQYGISRMDNNSNTNNNRIRKYKNKSPNRLHLLIKYLFILILCVMKDDLLGLLVNGHIASSGGGNSGDISPLGIFMIKSPESTIAPLGDEVLFECEFNFAPERLEWRFRPPDVKRGAKNEFIYLDENAGYNITSKDRSSKLQVLVEKRRVGEYQCVGWFWSSAIASVSAKLSLAGISLIDPFVSGSTIRRPMPSQVIHWKINPGNSIIIKCGDVASNPPPVWSFYKDNMHVSATVPQVASGGLILSPLTTRDTGVYLCTAVNSITGIEIKMPQKVMLTVDDVPRGPPTFLVQPPNVFSVRPGTIAILECPGVGNPLPKAVWSRPDGIIAKNRTIVTNYGLKILNATAEDRGMYTCRLDNGITPVLIHTIRLEILEPPIIVSGPKSTLTNESESLQLECLAKGSPQPEIYWLINGNDTRLDPLIKLNNSRMVIRSVEKKHAGIVQCFARNEVGEVSADELLRVVPKQIPGEVGSQPLGTVPQSTKSSSLDHTGKPPKNRKKHKHPIMIPPTRPSVTRLSDESVMVRWSVPANDGLPIQFFKVQHRMLGDKAKNIPRSQWMTSNEDIPPHVRSYEVDNLVPNNHYRFRIAAVYSNNDNKLGPTTVKFLLQPASELSPAKSHLIAPILKSTMPDSETSIALLWHFPNNPPTPIDGFYVYFRPASTAGEYSKATVDSMTARRFRIDHLEPGTSYEFKLQSFTASAASDFSAILTGKTLVPPTLPPSITPSVVAASDASTTATSLYPLIAAAAGGFVLLLMVLISICICVKRRRAKTQEGDDTNESKSHPDHIQIEPNGFPVITGGRSVLGSPMQKSSRLNGVVPRMNITPNPLSQDNDKNRNVMELRFLPNNNCSPSISETLQHRRTLDRSARSLHHSSPQPSGDNIVMVSALASVALENDLPRNPSLRRARRSPGSGPGSPRILRTGVAEFHQRSPMPVRAAGIKRPTLIGSNRPENMSSGSLNSIEV